MLYKYMKSEHSKMFLKDGLLRIGTLFDFKKNETFNQAVGDRREGSHFPYITFDEPRSIEDMTPTEKGFVSNIINMQSGVSFSSVSIGQIVTSSDYFIYCLTTIPSKKTMEFFECDTCIEIPNPRYFFRTLTREMHEYVESQVWRGPINYIDKEYHLSQDSGLHPATTKDPSFEYQKEYRGIWIPNKKIIESGELSPFLINAPKAVKGCRLVNLKK